MEYPATLEYFNKKRNGLASQCIKCRKEYDKQYREKNRNIVRKRNNDWYWKNKEYHNQKSKEHWLNNRESYRLRERRYRARKKNNGYEKYTEQDIFNKYGTDCYLCQKSIDLNIPRTEPEGLNIEHVIPIVKGGPDTLENVRPSHRNCNLSKHDKDLEEFLRHRETVKG
jgi:hypothetical protein